MKTETISSGATEQGFFEPALPPVNPAPDTADEVSVLDLLIVLAERKRLIFYVTAAFTILAIVVSLILPQRFTAIATLLPPQQSSSLAGALASQLGGMGSVAALAGGSLGLKNPNDQFVGMLQSRTVEDAMVQRYHLQQEYHEKLLSDARKQFEKRASIDGSGKDGLIHISVEDWNPARAAELANGYVEQFRNLSQHLAITEASQRRMFFERELEQSKDNLANAEEALKTTEQKTGVIQLDSQARALIETAASLRAQITAREVQIQGMQSYATGENAQLIQAQRELDSLRQKLAALGGSENAGSGELIVPKGLVPEAGLEYIRRTRDVRYYETIFEILARQFEIAKLDEAKEGALIQVVDPAIVPDRRSFPKRTLIVLGAAFAGLVIGILAALVQASWQRIQSDPETAQKFALLGTTMKIRSRPNNPGHSG